MFLRSLSVRAISAGEGTPASTSLESGQQSGFDVQFLPRSTGPRTASLTGGPRIYTLNRNRRCAGNSQTTAHPQPCVSAERPAGRRQSKLQRAGSDKRQWHGYAAISAWQAGVSDPGIAFASGGQTAPFTFEAGNIQATLGTGGRPPFRLERPPARWSSQPKWARCRTGNGFGRSRLSGVRFDLGEPFASQHTGASGPGSTTPAPPRLIVHLLR
jgi:hypothetical protein